MAYSHWSEQGPETSGLYETVWKLSDYKFWMRIVSVELSECEDSSSHSESVSMWMTLHEKVFYTTTHASVEILPVFSFYLLLL